VVDDLIEWASAAGNALYLVIFGLVFGESAFLLDVVVPGEVGLVLGASALRRAEGSLILLIVLAAIAATLGDSLSFWIGRRFGPEVATRWRFTRRHLEPALERARDRFERKGGAAVFVARWVGALRALVPLVAGAAGMPYGRFLAWAFPAAVLWAIAISCAGWYLGESVATIIDRLGWWVSVVVVGAILVWWLVRRHRRKDQPART
jgi:membrane protein DedA with SNARE-associated domain